MEGITKHIYRRAFFECFSGIDKFYTPFLSPNANRAIQPKEKKDLLPENNPGMTVVPQILTNQSDYFIRAAHELKEGYGYTEVNLNLGCPSGTVVSKGKGAGFLARTDELHRFLEDIFANPEVKISVKTRLGMTGPEEFHELLPLFNEYPLHELIVHPRVQKEGYKGVPHRELFAWAVRESRNPLCYNGDICTVGDYEKLRNEFPSLECVMIGRGLLANPMLAEQIMKYESQAEGTSGERAATTEQFCKTDIARLKKFHDKVYAAYRVEMQGDTNVLFKMKEFWVYFGTQFPGKEKYLKQIKKANRLSEYEAAVRGIF